MACVSLIVVSMGHHISHEVSTCDLISVTKLHSNLLHLLRNFEWIHTEWDAADTDVHTHEIVRSITTNQSSNASLIYL